MGVISNGTTLLDAGALDSGIATGAMTLIKTLTASSSGTLSFVHGTSSVVFDGTYKQYVFKFIDIHLGSNDQDITFNVSIDSGSNYNVAKTTTHFQAYNNETNGVEGLAYSGGGDMAQGTGFAVLGEDFGADNDQASSGIMTFSDPSSTTFVKHFTVQFSQAHQADYNQNIFTAGYANTTSAVNAIQFKISSGNIDSGTIKMYGIK
jgi:hypothetical protein